jgi:hypothetical protein
MLTPAVSERKHHWWQIWMTMEYEVLRSTSLTAILTKSIPFISMLRSTCCFATTRGPTKEPMLCQGHTSQPGGPPGGPPRSTCDARGPTRGPTKVTSKRSQNPSRSYPRSEDRETGLTPQTLALLVNSPDLGFPGPAKIENILPSSHSQNRFRPSTAAACSRCRPTPCLLGSAILSTFPYPPRM